MINGSVLQNRSIGAEDLSDRQREVVELVRNYEATTGEIPSSGWLARRLQVSRQTAYNHLRRITRDPDTP
jgi:DNA-binding CsgD family transcriptional regulator